MPALAPFTPAGTVSRSVTGTTASVPLSKATLNQVMVSSAAGNAIAFIKFGTTSVEAAVTDIPILPGTVQVFTVPSGGLTTHVAAIGTAGTTLYFTSGEGA